MIKITDHVYFLPEPGVTLKRSIAQTFTHVVNLGSKRVNYSLFSPTIKVKHVPLIKPHCLKATLEVADYIHKELKDQSSKLLIHSNADIDSSALYILIALMDVKDFVNGCNV